MVETINESFAIYSKTGAQQYTSTLQNWFGVSSGTNIFDPHVTFDPWNNRYAMVADDGTHWLLSVAQQTAAYGTWCNYSLNAITASGQFADYPEIGVDSQGHFYLTMVDFLNGSQVDSIMEQIPTARVESCKTVSPAQAALWTQIRDPGTACLLCSQDNLSFHIAPATTYDSLSSDGWMADAYPGGGSHITVFYVDSSDILHAQQVSTPAYTVPTSAAQQGTSAVLDTDEPDFTNVVKTGGELYLALTSGYNWGNGNNNSTINWMQINATAGSISLDLSGSFGYPGLWYFYPSTAGSAAAGEYQDFNFAVSGSTVYPSDAVASVDYTGAVTSIAYVLQGPSYYTGIAAQSGNAACSSTPCYRWGDFTSLLIDPNNRSAMWAAEADAPTPSTFSTQITQVND